MEEVNQKQTLKYWEDRAESSANTIQKYLKEGIPYTPLNDMIVYAQIVVPSLSEDELSGVDPKVLSAMFKGDLDGEVTERSFILISQGDSTGLDIEPGTKIQIRGHAFKITMPDGNELFTVRSHDVLGHYA